VCYINPPVLPKVPPQSATRYQSLTPPLLSYIPSTLLLVGLASQLLSRQFRIASPESSFVPAKGLLFHSQLTRRRAMFSGPFSAMAFVNDPSRPTHLLARPSPVTPFTLPDGMK